MQGPSQLDLGAAIYSRTDAPWRKFGLGATFRTTVSVEATGIAEEVTVEDLAAIAAVLFADADTADDETLLDEEAADEDAADEDTALTLVEDDDEATGLLLDVTAAPVLVVALLDEAGLVDNDDAAFVELDLVLVVLNAAALPRAAVLATDVVALLADDAAAAARLAWSMALCERRTRSKPEEPPLGPAMTSVAAKAQTRADRRMVDFIGVREQVELKTSPEVLV